MLYVKQINLNKSKLAHDNMCHLISKDKASIFLIQEPYWYKGRIPGIPRNYSIYGEINSRAITIVKDDLNCIYINEFSSADITTCCIMLGGKKRYFMSLYLDINKSPISATLVDFAEYINAKNENAIIGADSNAHSVLWNCDETNPRGEVLEEFIMQYNVHICNRGNKATFVSSRYATIIDLTLVIGDADYVDSWNVSERYYFSDHRMIQFKVKDDMPPPKLVPKINWDKLQNELIFKEANFKYWNWTIIEHEAKNIEHIISKAIKNSTTYRPAKTRKLNWWSNELQAKKQEVRKLERNFTRFKEADTGDKLKAAKLSYKKMIKKAKRKSWTEFCESICTPNDMAKFKKVIQGSTNKKIGMLEKAGGSYTRTVNETLELLMDQNFPGSTLPSGGADSGAHQNISVYDITLCESFITEDKVIEAFKTFGPEKAAGPDGIKPRVLQMLKGHAIKRITNLYKACIEIGYTPKRWRRSNVVFIPKPGKDNYSLVKSYRPISLMPFLLKALERIVLWELESKVLRDRPLSKDQHAFRKGYSCETGLSDFVDEIESQITRGGLALAVLCDIEGAFNNVQTKSAINAMRSFNAPDKITAWYGHYLNNRFAESTLNKVKITRQLTKSTPQGGVLSPVVFNMIFQSFLDAHKGGPVRARAYADDGVLLIKGCDAKVMVELMQKAVKVTERWGVEHGLRFCPQKTVAMFFHRKNKWEEPPMLKMAGIPLQYATTAKYLGVYLDTRLRWNFHIENKIKGAKKLIMMIRNATRSTWGPTPWALKWAYKGILIPSLSYGCIVWSRVCRNQGIRNKLTKLNRLMAQTMMPMRKGTPTAGLEVILDMPPLDLVVENLALKAMTRVLPHNRTRWDGLGKNDRGHLNWGLTTLKTLGIDPSDNDSLKWLLNVQRSYSVDLESLKSGLPVSASNTKCYTDGSRYRNKTGYGLGITRNNELIAHENGQLGQDNSVFQCEVMAIQRACILLRELGTSKVTIFSDSQSALLALSSTLVRSETVINCINNLNELADTAEVELKWVKAHADHTGNEYADMEAKSGTTNMENMVKVKKPVSAIKYTLLDAMYEAWNLRWRSSRECRQTKIWFPTTNRKESKNLSKLNRSDLGILVQMITGHNRLNRHEALVNQEGDPSCRLCLEEEETAWHLIGECPALWFNREQAFGSKFLDLNPEWNTFQMLRFAKWTNLKQLNNREAIQPT